MKVSKNFSLFFLSFFILSFLTTNILAQYPEVTIKDIKYETLVNEEKPAGTYELTWNVTNLTSGVYFYQMRAVDPSTSSGQGFVQTKKMLLLKWRKSSWICLSAGRLVSGSFVILEIPKRVQNDRIWIGANQWFAQLKRMLLIASLNNRKSYFYCFFKNGFANCSWSYFTIEGKWNDKYILKWLSFFCKRRQMMKQYFVLIMSLEAILPYRNICKKFIIIFLKREIYKRGKI